MLYFDKHPIIEYDINGNTYSFVDIFRRNIVNVDVNLTKHTMLEPNDTIESISKKLYGDETYSWMILLANNIYSRSKLPSMNQDIRLSNKKTYSIIDIIDIKFGDLIIRESDFAGFSLSVDPFLYVTSWDSNFRSIVVADTIPASVIAEDDLLLILRKDDIDETYDLISPSTGVTLQKITDFEEFPKRFSLNGSTVSPYLNVSGAGATYMSTTSTGTDFKKTILYSYITDGISHGIYDITSESSEFTVFANNNISVTVPQENTIAMIEREIEASFNVTNKSRTFTIAIQ